MDEGVQMGGGEFSARSDLEFKSEGTFMPNIDKFVAFQIEIPPIPAMLIGIGLVWIGGMMVWHTVRAIIQYPFWR